VYSYNPYSTIVYPLSYSETFQNLHVIVFSFEQSHWPSMSRDLPSGSAKTGRIHRIGRGESHTPDSKLCALNRDVINPRVRDWCRSFQRAQGIAALGLG